MRTPAPLPLLVPALAAVFALMTAGCSANEESAPSEEDSGSIDGEASSDDDGDEREATKAPAPPAGAPAAPAADPTTPTAPAAPAAPESPTTPTAPAGSSCAGLADAIDELESNDTAETANPMAGKSGFYCGKIGEGGDVDFVTFTLPSNATGLSWRLSFEGAKPDVTIAVGARPPVALGGNVAFVKGEPYVVKITGAANTSYRFGLALK